MKRTDREDKEKDIKKKRQITKEAKIKRISMTRKKEQQRTQMTRQNELYSALMHSLN